MLTLAVGALGYPRIQKFDERILLALREPNDWPYRSDLTGSSARLARSARSAARRLVFLIFSVLGYLWLERRYGILVLVAISTTGAGLISAALKDVLDRTRPTVVPHLVSVSSPSFRAGIRCSPRPFTSRSAPCSRESRPTGSPSSISSVSRRRSRS